MLIRLLEQGERGEVKRTEMGMYHVLVCAKAKLYNKYRPFSVYKNRRFADFLVYYWR